MKEETEGLIIKEKTIKENDRLVTVLTKDRGVIRCFVNGAKKLSNKKFTATQPLSYSRLMIYTKNDANIVDSADNIITFFKLRNSMERFALSQYFCQVIENAVLDEAESELQLKLMLNCLHMLCESNKPDLLIKSVFELRLMQSLGIIPEVLYCSGCGCYESDIMYFDPVYTKLYCSECVSMSDNLVELSKSALMAVRYILTAEPNKIFSFNINGQPLAQLADCSEQFIINHYNTKHFNTLDFYKMMRNENI